MSPGLQHGPVLPVSRCYVTAVVSSQDKPSSVSPEAKHRPWPDLAAWQTGPAVAAAFHNPDQADWRVAPVQRGRSPCETPQS